MMAISVEHAIEHFEALVAEQRECPADHLPTVLRELNQARRDMVAAIRCESRGQIIPPLEGSGRHRDIAERAMAFCDGHQEEANEALSLIRELWPALALERDRRIRLERKSLHRHAPRLLSVVKALAAGPEPCRMCSSFPHRQDCSLIHLIAYAEGE